MIERSASTDVLAVRVTDDPHALSLYKVEERARQYARESRAVNTRRAYRSDWADFTAWCQAHGRTALPASPETLVLYLSDRADTLKTLTLQRRLTAISQAHKAADLDTPTADRAVRRIMTGIRRQKGTAQEGKAPAITRVIRAMVAHLPPTLRGQRDRALLLLGFAGAFRRSELVSLDVGDLAWSDDGLTVRLTRSKTDQEGAGRTVGIPYGSKPATCPVRAVRAWLTAAEITDGPLFRGVDPHKNLRRTRLSDKTVARVVKNAAEAAGYDPALYAGHSLRAGLATAAAQAGVAERVIMAQTGHKSLPMVRKYIREGSLFTQNAAAEVGL
jgi:integrase